MRTCLLTRRIASQRKWCGLECLCRVVVSKRRIFALRLASLSSWRFIARQADVVGSTLVLHFTHCTMLATVLHVAVVFVAGTTRVRRCVERDRCWIERPTCAMRQPTPYTRYDHSSPHTSLQPDPAPHKPHANTQTRCCTAN